MKIFSSFRNILKQDAFTLIEIIVVVAVIGFLSASMLSSQKSSSARRQLNLDVQKTVQDLRNAQNLALSSQFSGDCGKVVAYGLVLNSSSPDRYFLAADCNGDNVYDSSNDIVLKTIFFQQSRINSLQAEGVGVDTLKVFFVPPLPSIFINGIVSVSAVSASINICHFAQTNLCKTINISSKGAVSTQ